MWRSPGPRPTFGHPSEGRALNLGGINPSADGALRLFIRVWYHKPPPARFDAVGGLCLCTPRNIKQAMRPKRIPPHYLRRAKHINSAKHPSRKAGVSEPRSRKNSHHGKSPIIRLHRETGDPVRPRTQRRAKDILCQSPARRTHFVQAARRQIGPVIGRYRHERYQVAHRRRKGSSFEP